MCILTAAMPRPPAWPAHRVALARCARPDGLDAPTAQPPRAPSAPQLPRCRPARPGPWSPFSRPPTQPILRTVGHPEGGPLPPRPPVPSLFSHLSKNCEDEREKVDRGCRRGPRPHPPRPCRCVPLLAPAPHCASVPHHVSHPPQRRGRLQPAGLRPLPLTPPLSPLPDTVPFNAPPVREPLP